MIFDVFDWSPYFDCGQSWQYIFWQRDKWFLHYKSYSNSQMDLCAPPPQQISMKRKNRNRIQRKFNSCAQVFAFFFLSWLLIFFPLYDIIHIYIRLKMSTLISKGEKITQFNIFFNSFDMRTLKMVVISFFSAA